MTPLLQSLALTLVLGGGAYAQTPSGQALPVDTTKIDQVFARWNRTDTPGCVLAVSRNGRITYEQAYGMGNLELDVPLNSSSVFNVGSISKAFTAAAILMLAEQGRISLDDDVRKHIPEVPDFGTTISVRHLLHHTSGLRDFLEMLEMAGWRNGDIVTRNDVQQMVSRQRTLNHRPGAEFVYTNTGYVLLAVLVERVTNQSLAEFARANIFAPLGMADTRFHDDHTRIAKGLVDAYLPDGPGFRKGMPAENHVGASNLLTTVKDLALWDQNFYHKSVGGPLVEQLQTPGTLDDGSQLDYAHGLFLVPYKGVRTVVQSGSTRGYQGTLLRFPDQQLSVTVLCNVRGNNPEGLARAVADIYLAEQLQPAPAPGPVTSPVQPAAAYRASHEELAAVEGLYWTPASDALRRVYLKDGKLMYLRIPGNENELEPIGSNRFRMLGIRSQVEITFSRHSADTPWQMFFAEAGRKPIVQEQVVPAAYDQEQLAQFAGQYHSPELDVIYPLAPQGEGLVFRTGNWGEFLLLPRFLDSFANQDEMGSLMFVRNGQGAVVGFVLRSGKVRNLLFNKVK